MKSLLRSAGQVMFQGNVWCGLLFIVGIFWGAYTSGTPAVAWGAVVGLVVSVATGFALGYPSDEATQGLWGFNGILVGCALMTFLDSTPLGWVALVVCAAMTTWVRRGLNRLGEPLGVTSFTFPFVLSTWIFLSAARMFGGLEVEALAHPMLPASNVHLATDTATSLPSFIEACEWTLRGISQVFLIDSWVTGVLFVVGLALSSPWAALWAVVGSGVGAAVALLFGAPTEAIAHGMYGFSPTLTAIALGTTFFRPSLRSALWALLGIVGTVFVQASMNELLAPVGLPSLTAPFCIATWLFMLPTTNSKSTNSKTTN